MDVVSDLKLAALILLVNVLQKILRKEKRYHYSVLRDAESEEEVIKRMKARDCV